MQQLDAEMKALEAQARVDIAQKRLALSKLLKDDDRLKMMIQALSSESSSLRVTLDIETNSSKNNKDDSLAKLTKNIKDEADDRGKGSRQQQQQQHQQMIAIKGEDVDVMILEERERDIRRINEDIALVNEMFRYTNAKANISHTYHWLTLLQKICVYFQWYLTLHCLSS